MDIFDMVFTYWVEILDGADWNVIHSPDWETTRSYADCRVYAAEVRLFEPGRPVRIVERAEGLPDVHIPIP